MPGLLAMSETEDLIWVARDGCTKAQARRVAADEFGRYDLKVRQGHIRELVQADCPAHPAESHIGTDAWDADESPEECRCFEIEEGWWDECSHRDPGAVPCWRVEVEGVD